MSRQEAEAYRSKDMDELEYEIPELFINQYCDNYMRGTGVYPQFCHGSGEQLYVKMHSRDSWQVKGDYQTLFEAQNKKEPEMADVFKVLTTVVIVSSTEFAKLPPAKQTEVLVTATGKPIVFVAHFNQLRNRKAIIKKLLDGEDVNVELEFNNIELSDDEKKTVRDVQPVLKKFDVLKPTYSFANVTDADQKVIDALDITDKRINNAGYYVTIDQAKKLWEQASKYWAGGKQPAACYRTLSGRSDNYVVFEKESVALGCQRVSRAVFEHVAQKLGWDFPEVKEA